jgi:hypothetical protein
LNQNPRRSSNRRNGKKSSNPSSDVPIAVAANKSPPLTPSKRWDALKPANRSNTTRQQRQPFSRKADRTETIHTDVAPRMLSDERQPPANDIASCFALPNSTVATADSHGLQQQTDYFFPATQDYMHSTNASAIRDANKMYDVLASNNQAPSHTPPRSGRIQFTGLNPNSNSWTGTLNVVPKAESYAYPPNSDSFHHGNGVFGFDVPRFQGVHASITDSLSHQLAPPKIENINDGQPLQFYTNEGVDTSSNEFSMQSELSTPSFDLSFLHNIPESNSELVENSDNYNNIRYPVPSCTTTSSSPLYVPTVDSTLMTMMMTTPDTTGTNASTPTSSPYHRNYHYHHNSHVRDNPFAESDDDDDDDQIEAKLLELGGQMVGSILDF